MRIQHNIMAMNAYRNYTSNVNAMKSNLEKLSSGYKINRAGDDAAGLAISEKMRAQITGLNAAQKNVKDGISLVQTAEGAMQEVQDMLNRMVYLATQSANGTYDDEVDRNNLQKELDQLRSEIDRISDSANFNGIKLLDGSKDASVSLDKMSAVTVEAVADGNQSGNAKPTAGQYSFDLDGLDITADAADASLGAAFTLAGKEFYDIDTDGTLTTTKAVDHTALNGNLTGEDLAKKLDGKGIELNGIVYKASVDGTKVTLTANNPEDVPKAADLTKDFSIILTKGADATINNGFDQSVHIDTPPVADGGDTLLAQGKFTLKAADVQNGKALKIGQETYVFQVGDENITAGAGQKVIKLTAGQTDAQLVKEAAEKLSQQDNKEFHITTKGDADGTATSATMHLTEKPGAIIYAKSDYDLEGEPTDAATTGTEKDATWENVVWKGTPTKNNPDGDALTFQIGDTADSFNQLKVSIGDIHTKALGIDGISIATQDSAADAVQKIKDAINTVSSIRGDLGATQNRLEHTANNLSVMQENITDAESSIRDTDVAEEMMAYTKNNILIQAAQAMLAQANQIPQGVLQLLQ